MNKHIKQFERESELDVYALGLDKVKWESRLDKFAELLIEECARRCDVVRENNGGDKQFGARLCADEIRYLNRRS
jgi:hypothetical protein